MQTVFYCILLSTTANTLNIGRHPFTFSALAPIILYYFTGNLELHIHTKQCYHGALHCPIHRLRSRRFPTNLQRARTYKAG